MTIDPNQVVALTATLQLLLNQVDQDEREKAIELLLAFIEAFDLRRAEVPHEDPVVIANRLHEGLDLAIATGKATGEHANEITCRRGCAHCCHMRVGVLPEEAALLYDTMQAKGLVIDQARLATQLQWSDDDDVWKHQPPEDRRCLFLNDQNECQVYEQRPLSCRKYFVVSDPALCQIEKHPDDKVGIWFDAKSEIITSAAMTFYDVGSLPHMLVKAAQDKIRPTKQQGGSS